MDNGVYVTVSNACYHGDEAVNKSLLDAVARSPLHAKAMRDQANDRVPTPSMELGTAFHTLVLEPHKFADEYVCELTREDAPHAIADRDVLVGMIDALNAGRLPKLATSGAKADLVARIIDAQREMGLDVDSFLDLEAMKAADLKARLERLNSERPGKLSTSGSMHELAAILADNGQPVTLWQDVRARWDAENAGMVVLSVATFDQLQGMARAVADHPAALALFTGEGRAELSVFWTDKDTGEQCRVRPDWWRRDGVLVDLKSTKDASPEGFAKSVAQYRYHVQAPWYLDGTQAAYDAGHLEAIGLQGWDRPRAFVFVAVESHAPYAVAAYVLDPESMELGRLEMRADLERWHECKRLGKFPGYGEQLAKLGVPAYYLNRQAAKAAGGAA